MVVGLYEFLLKVSKLKKTQEKIDAIKYNDSIPLRIILQGAFDPSVVWLLPEGTPPFRANKFDEPKALHLEVSKFYLFIEGGNNNLKPVKRENLFIQMLERVNEDDANLLIAMKDKKSPFKGITKDIVMAAFPGLLPNE